jgi:hypothetical protein
MTLKVDHMESGSTRSTTGETAHSCGEVAARMVIPTESGKHTGQTAHYIVKDITSLSNDHTN